MDGVILAAMALLAVILVAELKGKFMPDFISQTAIGALIGSGLSVWWRKAIRWQVNLAAGFFIGWWGADWLIAFMAWPPTDELSRAAGSALGLIGFSLIDGVMRVDWSGILRRFINSKAKQATDE